MSFLGALRVRVVHGEPGQWACQPRERELGVEIEPSPGPLGMNPARSRSHPQPNDIRDIELVLPYAPDMIASDDEQLQTSAGPHRRLLLSVCTD